MQQCLPLAVLKLFIKHIKAVAVGLLQQCLPLAVLKLTKSCFLGRSSSVATVLTACGIETVCSASHSTSAFKVATVLTACGIETFEEKCVIIHIEEVATVLTACGIETDIQSRKNLTIL